MRYVPGPGVEETATCNYQQHLARKPEPLRSRPAIVYLGDAPIVLGIEYAPGPGPKDETKGSIECQMVGIYLLIVAYQLY